MKRLWLGLYLVMVSLGTYAQVPTEKIVKIIMAPDHKDWTYKLGEQVKFSVAVYQYGNLVSNVSVQYEIGEEKMEPAVKRSEVLKEGHTIINGGTMTSPGFLRCRITAEVGGRKYTQIATAGFTPEAIQPTVSNPSDFDTFWNKALAELSQISLEPKMKLLPERCTGSVNVYEVSFQHYRPGGRMYGILCVPKKEGKYPAVLRLPGAGIRPYAGDVANAEKGMITLEIGIHGIPVTMEPVVYDHLSSGALSGYMFMNLDNRDQFYFKRIYLGCVRANDFLTGLPQYDGVNLAVRGGSQGGALSIVTAALDARVKWVISYATALCDVTGYLKGRAGGWPHYFSSQNMAVHHTKEKVETVGYFDVVNFARRLKVPGFYSWGFNDEVCPPTSMFAAYNVIGAPKELYLPYDVGHWRYPEQDEKMDNWLLQKMKLVK